MRINLLQPIFIRRKLVLKNNRQKIISNDRNWFRSQSLRQPVSTWHRATPCPRSTGRSDPAEVGEGFLCFEWQRGFLSPVGPKRRSMCFSWRWWLPYDREGSQSKDKAFLWGRESRGAERTGLGFQLRQRMRWLSREPSEFEFLFPGPRSTLVQARRECEACEWCF